MDVNTKKFTSVAFVALLVGSVMLAAIPAAAQTPNPTPGATPTVVNAGLSYTESDTTLVQAAGTVNNITTPSAGIEFNRLYDLTITNVSGVSVSDEFDLVPHGGSSVDTRPAATDNAHLGNANITFPGFTPQSVGLWYVYPTGTTTGAVATFIVSAQTNLQVTLSQTSFTFSESATSFVVTVTNLSEPNVGQPVANAKLTGPGFPGGAQTNAQGTYTFFGPLPEVGSHTVTASRDLDGDTLAEFRGKATYSVTAAALQVEGIDTTILHGFTSPAAWNITYPNNMNGILGDQSTFQRYNLTVTLPNGSILYHNATTTPTDATGSILMRNSTEGDIAHAPDVWGYNGNGNFSFAPAGPWAAGTYSFSLQVNTLGTATRLDRSEYTASWSLTTQAPQPVNVVVKESGAEVKALPVLQASNAGASNIAAGAYSLEVSIEGDILGQFPSNSNSWDGFTAANVTMSGDVLPGWTTAYNAGTGIATVSGVVPTDVGGSVSVHVAWKNTTTTVSVPIGPSATNQHGGAKSTIDVSEIIVDQTTTVTVTVRDSFDNPVPNAQVFFMEEQSGLMDGVGLMSINGTGAPGLGQGGQYTANVRPSEVGNLTVYAIIGTISGTIDNRNFTYESIRVVPAHDLQVSLSVQETMASQTTHVFVNATTPDGVGIPVGTHRVYFLTAAEHEKFLEDGASALPAYPQTNSGNGTNVAVSGATTAGINMNVTLGPGTYHVYVCSHWTSPADCTSAKHDNLDNVPTFTVHRYQATFSPSRIADTRDIQENTQVNVTIVDSAGAPVNGTLMLDNPAFLGRELNATGTWANLSTGIDVVEGQTSFVATGNFTGTVWFAFNPSGGHSSHASRVDSAFEVTGPNVTVSPARIAVGQTTPVTITVRTLDGEPMPGKSVRICGSPIGGSNVAPMTITDATTGCTGAEDTDANGVARVGLNPSTTGTLYLYVNNTRTSTTVPVIAGLVITVQPSNPQAGESVTLTVAQPGRTGEADVNVTVTLGGENVTSQITGSSGQIVVPDLEEGTYTVTASKAGFETATETFTVGAAEPVPTDPAAKFELSDLQAPASGTVGSGLTVTAKVSNTGDAAGEARVSLLVNGVVRDTKSVPVSAGGSETIGFDFTPNTAGSYTVTVRMDGQTLAERTVEVTTPTPATPTDPTPTDPTPPAEPTGVPGFGVFALIVALGAAMLVFRRKD